MWLDNLLFRSPLQPLFHHYFQHHLTILAYHGIDHPERFEKQIQYISQKMRPVTLEEVIRSLNSGQILPERAILITFDDGHRTIFEVALPILKKYSVPGVVFVITSLLATNTPFWWEETKWMVRCGATVTGLAGLSPEEIVRRLKHRPNHERLQIISELRQAVGERSFLQPQLQLVELLQLEAGGIAVGNHTHTHPALDQLDDKAVTQEIMTAHNILTSALGHTPKAFAYPYGYVNYKAVPVLQQLGYATALLFDHKLSHWPPPNPYKISRLRVDSDNCLERFGIILSGLHPTIHHTLGRN